MKGEVMDTKYLSVAGEINALSRPLRWYWIGALLINVLVIVVATIIILKANTPKNYSTLETCLYGMESIFNNNADEVLVDRSVSEDVTKKQVVFDIERLHLVKYLDSSHCDVVAKDNLGYRNYRVTLEHNSSFEHYYKILDVSE